MPEAFITASRQYVAQANQWSLEELYLKVTVANNKEKLDIDDCSFLVSGKIVFKNNFVVHKPRDFLNKQGK